MRCRARSRPSAASTRPSIFVPPRSMPICMRALPERRHAGAHERELLLLAEVPGRVAVHGVDVVVQVVGEVPHEADGGGELALEHADAQVDVLLQLEGPRHASREVDVELRMRELEKSRVAVERAQVQVLRDADRPRLEGIAEAETGTVRAREPDVDRPDLEAPAVANAIRGGREVVPVPVDLLELTVREEVHLERATLQLVREL